MSLDRRVAGGEGHKVKKSGKAETNCSVDETSECLPAPCFGWK